MANKAIPYPLKASEMEAHPCFCSFVVDGAGAVSSYTGKDVLTIAKSATGTYKVTLKDSWYSLLDAHATILKATAISSDVQIVAEAVSNATVPYVSLGFKDAAGSLADLASCTVYATIWLKNARY